MEVVRDSGQLSATRDSLAVAAPKTGYGGAKEFTVEQFLLGAYPKEPF